jgi:hypothetical protein
MQTFGTGNLHERLQLQRIENLFEMQRYLSAIEDVRQFPWIEIEDNRRGLI